MTGENKGDQIIIWKFETPLIGEHLSKAFNSILYTGIYTGLNGSRLSDYIIQFTTGDILIRDTDGKRIIKDVFESPFNVTVDISTYPVLPAQYLVLRYTWIDAVENYVGIVQTDMIGASDLLLGRIIFEDAGGSWRVGSFDSGFKSKGLNYEIDRRFDNLKPSISKSIDRRVDIASGVYFTANTKISFAGGFAVLDASSHIDGRYDVIGLNSSGSIVVTKGIEGGSVPLFEVYYPLVIVHIRQGVGILSLIDFDDIRVYNNFCYDAKLLNGLEGNNRVITDDDATYVTKNKAKAYIDTEIDNTVDYVDDQVADLTALINSSTGIHAFLFGVH